MPARSELIAEFWSDVERLLMQQYGFTEAQADRGIRDYRERLESHNVSDAVYNAGPDDAATSIAAAVKRGGFVEPESMEP